MSRSNKENKDYMEKLLKVTPEFEPFLQKKDKI